MDGGVEQVPDRVDVEGEIGVGQDAHRATGLDCGALGGGTVPFERTRAVVGAEPGIARIRDHVGAVAATVGDDGDASSTQGPADDVEQPSGTGEIGVGDHHVRRAPLDDEVDPGVDRAVQPEPRGPGDLGPGAGGPRPHLGVVACDDHTGRTVGGRRPDHAAGQVASEPGSIPVVEGMTQPLLGGAERLDRQHDGDPGRCVHGDNLTPLGTPLAVGPDPAGPPLPWRHMPTADAPDPGVADAANSITIGATGQRRRWSVSPWGAVLPWGADEPAAGSLEWFVAADDRWHVPAQEPAVRQRRIDGSPVVETRIRVPDGDAVQRVWSVPDRDGVVVVEFENASPLPLAVAVTGDAIATERPPADVPVEGIELPGEAIVLPIGHHASVRVVLGTSAWLPTVPPALSVVRGWTRVVEQASRLVLPDPAISEAVVAARCDLLLEGPVDPDVDPIGFLLDVGELVRCGDAAEPWLVEMVGPAESLVSDRRGLLRRRGPAAPVTVESLDALAATRRVAATAGDARAVADLDRLTSSLPRPDEPQPLALADLRRGSGGGGADGPDSVGRFVRRVERRLASGSDLLPGGVPSAWLGADFEVHGLPTGPDSAVGFAVRWHGERPAVLWEQRGEPLTLTARSVDPDWSSDAPSGEALWAVPANATLARRPISFTVEGVTRDDA